MVYTGDILAEGTDRPTMSSPAGPAFPSTFLTGDIFFRTDLNTIYVRKSAAWEPIGGSGAIDTGGVVAISTTTVPFGFFECDGSTISRTTYATLFATIGTTFGAGDGSTTFKLPDLRGEFIRGFDNARGVDSGRAIGTYQQDQFQGHYHADNTTANVVQETSVSAVVGFDSSNEMKAINLQILNPTTGTNGSPRFGDETRPRNIAMMFVIKY